MIVKTKDDVVGTKGEKQGDKWHSLRLLHKEDGMGVTFTDTILEPEFEMDLWQKNHLEACYLNDHDRHRIRAKTRMRIVCTFFPALTGEEVHDADGSL
jgi:L-ectoine synthase